MGVIRGSSWPQFHSRTSPRARPKVVRGATKIEYRAKISAIRAETFSPPPVWPGFACIGLAFDTHRSGRRNRKRFNAEDLFFSKRATLGDCSPGLGVRKSAGNRLRADFRTAIGQPQMLHSKGRLARIRHRLHERVLSHFTQCCSRGFVQLSRQTALSNSVRISIVNIIDTLGQVSAYVPTTENQPAKTLSGRCITRCET